LIKSYAQPSIKEIFEIVNNIENKIYYDDSKQISKILNKYIHSNIIFSIFEYGNIFDVQSGGSDMTVHALTNNSFIVFLILHAKYTMEINCKNTETICKIYEIKFNQNKKKIYVEILKQSTTLSINQFINKYENIFKNEKIKTIPSIKIHEIFTGYNIKLFNIKIERHEYEIYKKYIPQCENHSDIPVSNIKTYFPNEIKQNIVIKSYQQEHSLLRNINIHNLE
jgi:hypothetical protein